MFKFINGAINGAKLLIDLNNYRIIVNRRKMMGKLPNNSLVFKNSDGIIKYRNGNILKPIKDHIINTSNAIVSIHTQLLKDLSPSLIEKTNHITIYSKLLNDGSITFNHLDIVIKIEINTQRVIKVKITHDGKSIDLEVSKNIIGLHQDINGLYNMDHSNPFIIFILGNIKKLIEFEYDTIYDILLSKSIQFNYEHNDIDVIILNGMINIRIVNIFTLNSSYIKLDIDHDGVHSIISDLYTLNVNNPLCEKILQEVNNINFYNK